MRKRQKKKEGQTEKKREIEGEEKSGKRMGFLKSQTDE